jgi:WD40 repeat protein
MVPQPHLLAATLQALQGAWLSIAGWIDALWGYDVFIAHRRTDAAAYAQALYEKLTTEKISCFIDRVVYGPGDSLLVATRRHVAKSSLLLLVGSPDLLVARQPVDWIEREIDTYLTSHADDPKVILVDFGAAVADACARSAPSGMQLHPILSQLAPFLRISEALPALTTPPSEEVLSAIRKKLDGRRRDRTRMWVFEGIAAVLFVLLIITTVLGFLSETRRQAAETRSAQLLGARAQQLLQQPVTNETAAVIPAAAAYGWRLSHTADTWSALQSLVWTGVTRSISHDGDVQALTFNLDGTLLATVSTDGKLRLAGTKDGNVETTLTLEEHGWGNAVAFNRDSTLIATGSGLGGILRDEEKRHGIARLFRADNRSQVWAVDTDAPVYVVAFDPLGRFVAIGSDDGTSRLLATTNGAEVTRMDFGGHLVRTLTFSHDGRWLAAGSSHGEARVLAIETGRSIAYRYGDKVEVSALAFAPDDRLLAIALGDGTVHLQVPTEGGGSRDTLNHDGGKVNAIAFSTDGRLIATAGNDRTARIFDVEDQRQLFRMDHGEAVAAVAFSPDGRYLATGSDSTARLWSVPDGRVRAVLAHGSRVNAVRFSADGRLLATAADHTARIFPIVDSLAEEARVTSGSAMRAVAFSADSRLLAVGGDDGFVTVLPVAGSDPRVKIAAGGTIAAIAFSHNADVLATAGEGGIRIARLRDNTEMASFPHDNLANSVAFSPDGRFFAGGGLDGTAELVTTGNWKTVRRFVLRPEPPPVPADVLSDRANGAAPAVVSSGPSEQVFAVAFSEDSRILAIGSSVLPDSGLVHLVSLDTLKDLPSIRREDWVTALAFNHHDALLAVAGAKTVDVLETIGGRALAAHAQTSAPIAFSADGKLLAATGVGRVAANTVILYPIGSSKRETRIILGGAIAAIALSPDVSLLAAASADGTIRIIDVRTGVERARIAHELATTAVAFSPNGQLVATASEDGTARLWRTDFDLILKRLCAGPGPNLGLAEWHRYIGELEWQPTCPGWPDPDDVKAAGLVTAGSSDGPRTNSTY